MVLVSSRSEIDDIAKEGVVHLTMLLKVIRRNYPSCCFPVIFNAKDPVRDVIEPAVKSTLSQLNYAQKYGKNTSSITVTSSMASVLNSQVGCHVYKESDWNDGAYQAAFLSTVLPGYVYSAIVPTPESLDKLKAASSANLFLLAHVRGVERADKTDGERYVSNAGAYHFQQALNASRKTFTDHEHIILEAQTDYYDGSQTTRELNIQYNSFEDVVLSTVNSVKHFY
ncbi:unnamed protein product [Umbelopsis vinacea]